MELGHVGAIPHRLSLPGDVHGQKLRTHEPDWTQLIQFQVGDRLGKPVNHCKPIQSPPVKKKGWKWLKNHAVRCCTALRPWRCCWNRFWKDTLSRLAETAPCRWVTRLTWYLKLVLKPRLATAKHLHACSGTWLHKFLKDFNPRTNGHMRCKAVQHSVGVGHISVSGFPSYVWFWSSNTCCRSLYDLRKKHRFQSLLAPNQLHRQVKWLPATVSMVIPWIPWNPTANDPALRNCRTGWIRADHSGDCPGHWGPCLSQRFCCNECLWNFSDGCKVQTTD